MPKDKRRKEGLRVNKRISKAIFIIIAVVAIFFIFFKTSFMLFIKELAYFKVNQLVVIEDGQLTQSYKNEFVDFQGKNIFGIDLLKLSGGIQRDHPEFHTVRVVRVIPDKLIIELQRRKSVAQVKLDKYYLVDTEGFILPTGKNFPFNDLSIINLPSVLRNKDIELGKRCDLDELKTSLTLLKQFSNSSGLKGYKIITITINSPEDISFLIDNLPAKSTYNKQAGRLEIKLAEGDLKEKLQLLSRLLPEVTARGDIKYIDLRFKDPIIKPK